MRPTTAHKSEAFTLVELMMVIVVVFVVVSMFLPFHRVHTEYPHMQCVNNLKQIGTAYRIWANDNGGHFPASQSVTNGGWRELLTNAS